jgi:trk system potassium uptake protein TrkH
LVNMRITSILEGLFSVTMIVGGVMTLVPIVDALYNNPVSLSFLWIGLLIALTSYTAYFAISKIMKRVEITYIEALTTYSLTWLVVPVLSAIPLSIETGVSYIDALFESISGFTGTGLTIYQGLDYMKKGILFWRGLMQWMGELGVVVFASIFLPFFWQFGRILYRLERPSRISASLRETALRIFYIYFLLTVVGIVVCIYLGVEPLDAVVHVMTAIATGGMSNYDDNYGRVFQYAPLSVYPITALMIIGGFNFITLSIILDGDVKKAWSNEELRGFIYLNLFFTVTSFIITLPSTGLNPLQSLTTGSFNAISAVTTTGFSIGNISGLSPSLKLLLVLAMFIGGMSFSTAGGIKVVRLVVLLKKIKAYILGVLSSGSLSQDIRLGEEVLDEREVSNMLLFISLHFLAVFTGAVVIKSIIPSVDFVDALFEATSAGSAVGLSTGITSLSAPVPAKVVLMTLMYFGRLEYMPLIVLIGFVLYRRLIQLITI